MDTPPNLNNVNYQTIEQEVRRLAAAHPDHVAEQAQYVSATGDPICIFGHALLSLGVQPKTLVYYDWTATLQGPEPISTNIAYMMAEVFDVPEHSGPIGRWWAERVQRSQDNGHSWGEAVRLADAFVGEATT